MHPGVQRSAWRRAAGLGLVGAVTLASLVAGSSPAHAAAPMQQGYWWRARNHMAPSIPPPTVPEGGLWVAADGGGQHAVSALRYRARPGEEITTVVLDVARQSGADIVLLACSAAGPWTPVQGGAWDERPATSCDVAFVTGAPTADGRSWRFDVRGLARTGTLDLVILPKQEPGAIFSLSFERPGASAVVTRPALSPSPSSSPASSPRTASGGSSVFRSDVRRTVAPTPTQAAQQPTSSPFVFAAPDGPIQAARNRLPFIGVALLVLVVPIVLWRRVSRREPPGPEPPAGPSEDAGRSRSRRFRTRASGVTARLCVRVSVRHA